MADEEPLASAEESRFKHEDNGPNSQMVENGRQDSVTAMRPIFMGNLMPEYSVDDVSRIFEKPEELNLNGETRSFPVDRVDVKRGFCFVFLKDGDSSMRKEVESFLNLINGM